MSHANPTPLRLGLSGVLGGRRYRVVGRVVMSMDEAGGTYYWNEFNLANDAGETATLVYEETERGPEWRLFTLIEPPPAISAAEARGKRIGDRITLEGQTARVTLVDQSRVCHLEGVAPEGVELGDRADYFNVGAGTRMWVVSWTGNEVECFRGVTIPATIVARAFGVALREPSAMRASLTGPSATRPALPNWLFNTVIVVIFVGVVLFAGGGLPSCSSPRVVRRPDVPKILPAPASRLAVGDTGRLGDRSYRVAGHTVREARKAGLVFHWHEYHLIGEDNTGEVLVLGLFPPQRTWYLFHGARTEVPLTPHQAATKRLGDRLDVNGVEVTVVDLFLSQGKSNERAVPPGLRPAGRRYHFRAEAPGAQVLANWDDTGLELLRGWSLTEAQVIAAFGAKISGTR